jgi:GTP cyclohydrolase I
MNQRIETTRLPRRVNGKRQELIDVQSSRDERGVAIDRVGVTGLRLPVSVPSRDGMEQQCVATVNMYVNLPPQVRGTHMSRFVELLREQQQPLTAGQVLRLCHKAREQLDAGQSQLELDFEYFVHKEAPVTGSPGPLNYQVGMAASSGLADDFVLSVRAPATSLCPCSKRISQHGAHSQRCEIEARVRFTGDLWIEDLIELIEASASCPVYSVLKRPDEKQVTERAYENPKFVEDIVRDLALALQADDRIVWFSVSSENFESIHNHNAYARIERDKRVERPAADRRDARWV